MDINKRKIELVKLEKIIKIKKGAMPKKSSDKKWFDNDSNHFLIKVSDVNDFGYIYNSKTKMSNMALPYLYLVKKNEIIITEGGTPPGKIAILKNNFFIDYHIYHLINVNDKLIKNNYLFYFFKANEFEFKKNQMVQPLSQLTKILLIIFHFL